MTAGAVATLSVGAIAPKAASADTTSTVLTAAAVIGGIALIAGAANQPNYEPPCAYYGDCAPPVVYGAPGWQGRPVYVDRGRVDDRRFAQRDERGGRR